MPRTAAVIPPRKPDRIAPDEPPGIEPLPGEPLPPDLPETAPPPPDFDEPDRCPEEFPGPQEHEPLLPGLLLRNWRSAA